MKNKENEDKKDSKISKEIVSTNSKILILEIFLKVFVLIAGILAFTMYFYFKANNYYEEEISMTRDIHHLKAYFKGYNNHLSIKGHVEITEIHEGLNIQGRIEGLSKGSIHGVHVLQYSDITDLEKNIATDDVLKHFNPKNKAHSCPSTNNYDDDNFHFGDFGNVMANQDGIAFISFIKNIPLRSLNGRIIVILANEDKCDSNQEKDNLNNLIGYGLLNAYKPKLIMGVDRTNEYFLREINSVNKIEFEKKNNISEPPANRIQENVNKIKKKINVIKREHVPIVKKQILSNNPVNSVSKIEPHSTSENKTKTDINEINNLNVLKSSEQEEKAKIVNENRNLENILKESEIKVKPPFTRHPDFLTNTINTKSNEIKTKSNRLPRNEFFRTSLSSKKINEHNKEKDKILNDLSSNNILSEFKNEKEKEPLIVDDVVPKTNLFEDLLNAEEQTKDLEEPKVEKEMHKPVFANKKEEPHFIHINNKISTRDRRELPFFLRPSEDLNLNPFINSVPQSSQKKIERKPITEPYNKEKFIKEDFKNKFSNNKNQQLPTKQANFGFDDFFSNLFKDEDNKNISNDKYPFFIPQSPTSNIDEKPKENSKSNLDSYLKMDSIQPKLEIDKVTFIHIV
jgi:Cu/Zn superoxide dismutase